MPNTVRSPLPWMGGKYHLARRILDEFPPADTYDTYVEPFGGAAHVLLLKPVQKHFEVYNDLNGDLVNFWLQCRDNADELQKRLNTLPYSRQLYYEYHKSLFQGASLTPLDRAERWFYVLRGSFLPVMSRSPQGWGMGSVRSGRSRAQSYYNALQLFASLSVRFRSIEIDNRDFEHIICQHQSPRTLFYCDPPYVDAEHYYEGRFGLDDHKRLAKLLNETPAYVALSYYPHPLIDQLYLSSRWRRVTWTTVKHSQRTKQKHDAVSEMLLLNYPAVQTCEIEQTGQLKMTA